MKTTYAICAGHQRTAEAAQQVLDAGGNAVDAAIAAYWMMMLAEPCMASLGAGGFAMINWQGKTECLDFFCQTPRIKRPARDIDFFPITVDFGGATEDFYVGRGSAATPGAVAGLFAMHDRYGSIPMGELVAPTVSAATEGVVLDRFQAFDWHLLQSIYALDPEVRPIFFRDDGSLKVEGDLVKMPALGATIQAIGQSGADLVYKGEIAQRIAHDCRLDGSLTILDMSQYQAVWRRPLAVDYVGRTVHATPAPSVGGALIAAFLLQVEDAETVDLVTLAQSSRRTRAWSDHIDQLTAYLRGHGVEMSEEGTAHKWGGTSHFNIIDRSGNAVALTSSIGEGNGYFVPGTEMQLNNMLGEAALLPGGYHSWQPNTRLRSMMTPTIVTDTTSQPIMITGSGGAGRIPQMIAQVIDRYVRQGYSLNDAVDSARIYYDGAVLQAEPTVAVDQLQMPYNLWQEQSLYFGGTHSIGVNQLRSYAAAPDHRRYGYAIVSS